MIRIVAIIFLLACLGCDPRSQASPGSAPLPKSIAGAGVLRGVVEFAGSAPEMSSIVANEPCCENDPPLKEETVVVNANATLRNVFVYLEDAPALDGSEQPPVLLDQVRCRYVPHAVAVQVGQPLRVRSSDPTMHNVHYIPQKNRARNLSMTQAGQEVLTRFTHPEFIRMRCDVHPWMAAWVGVFENPFFAVTGEDGTFEISGIPGGTYTLVAWHELYGSQRQSVRVADGAPLQARFVFGKQS